MYTNYSTSEDVMKEFLIYGSELTEHGFPMLPKTFVVPDHTIDFSDSFNRNLKGHKNINVNFYIHDKAFQRIWNNPDKYLDHLKCFHSICGIDFTIDTQMPLVMQMWNKYRNMALDYYLIQNGIDVIPNINILPYKGCEWILEGFSVGGTVSCSTNGRVRSKKSREEFCQGFYEMCDIIKPNTVVMIGNMPDELSSPVPIINLKSRNQIMNSRIKGEFCGNNN